MFIRFLSLVTIFAFALTGCTTSTTAITSPGWQRLFDGRSLTHWRGLPADPPAFAAMSLEQRAKAQHDADDRMRAHWSITDGVLTFDGKGDNLCTAENFADFELRVDWCIPPGGDSGIYLRGTPQVQIWD
ncbi:MAG TPA: DUF1080 domain-containing protein, partial [Phycisphaerales bacterium]|nr:DUF1080 domain-containing protein [Phycisphaerales bacterium]